MTIPTISTLPTAPARTDAPATFISRADAFLAALVTMQSELNTSIGAMNTDIAGVNADATTASNAATAAAASQAAAEAASNATEWVSGTSYSEGDVVYSPITYLSYRAIQATSGTTDPSTDTANWVGLNVSGGSGEQTFTATGAISTGDLIALNSDGTVSVIGETAGPPVLGSPTQASGTGAINGEVTACYDPDQDAIFVAYRDQTSGGYLYGLVGTVSGSTITWGTPAVIYSQSVNYMDSVYYPDDNRVAVVFNRNTTDLRVTGILVDGANKTFSRVNLETVITGNHSWPRITYDPDTGKFITCSYSSTNSRLEYSFGSISSGFTTVSGTGAIYDPGATVRTPDITYDESQNKVLVVFAKETTRYGAAIVGTVGASSITWGSDVTFENANVTDGELHVRYDPTSQKSIVAYRLSANRYANTITISGTTPSFGTETNTGSGTGLALNYDSGAGKVVEMYKKTDTPDQNYLYFDTYSISGTTVVVDSSTALTTSTYDGSDTNRHMEIVYDTDGILVAVYDDDTNSTITGIAYDKETTTTNAADFIGISKEDIDSAASGTVYVNTGISKDQTGLTAKTGYYVTSTGGLSSTATGYPFVGYATSATDILIGGKNLPSETGQSGKFLTTDGSNLSWGTAGGVWEVVEEITASGASTIDIESFTADYDVYNIFFTLEGSNTSSHPLIRLKTGGSYQTSNYSYLGIIMNPNNGSGYTAIRSTSTSRIQPSTTTFTAGDYMWGRLGLGSANQAAQPNTMSYDVNYTLGTVPQRVIGTGQHNSDSVLQGIRIYGNASGTLTGKVIVLGLKNSAA